MALGDKTDTIAGRSYVIELLASAIAANGAPTGTAGIEINSLAEFGQVPDKIRVGVNSTAGSGTMSVTLRVWGRAGGVWFRLKDLNASSAAPHTAVAIAGTSTAVTGYALVNR